jgi:ubiquinol-cytochrome c reductase iron-sulfur subunit
MSVEDNKTGLAEPTRRDFLYISTAMAAAVGTAAALWPFIDSMQPSADVSAIASIEVDLSSMEPGQRVTVKWRGRPVFIVHRTPALIAQARADDSNPALIDPALDSDRIQRPEWLVMIGVCTHLGCIPLGQHDGDPRGPYGGWFCPCHGSIYDSGGRVRKGPAPRNLVVPPYVFPDEFRIRLG